MTNTYAQNVIDNVIDKVKVDTGEIVNAIATNSGTGKDYLAQPRQDENALQGQDIFVGISMLNISRDISDKLMLPVKQEDIEIKPTGQIYLCHIRYRKMLNDAFGMGNWALRPLGGFVKTGDTVCREYALYIKGMYAASAIGEQEYVASNPMMTWSDACEATKSNAIMRCCKDLGIALELWDKKYVEKFIKEYCVQVWRKGKLKPQWRLKTAERYFDETGIVTGKPGNIQPEPDKQVLSNAIDNTSSIVTIKDVTMTTGLNKDTGRMWTKYHIITDTGEDFPTFDKKIADESKKAKEGAYSVILKLETKGKYRNIIGLGKTKLYSFAGDEPEPNPEMDKELSELAGEYE
ncbi:MAG: hypothetical protein A2W17_01425 [Planctomycetes bacterium RBG_16_41_13]|nr:MAG: hypothetical protein A2W17_01425 [Planctomycetes bacterium RBG_16_41_13]